MKTLYGQSFSSVRKSAALSVTTTVVAETGALHLDRPEGLSLRGRFSHGVGMGAA